MYLCKDLNQTLLVVDPNLQEFLPPLFGINQKESLMLRLSTPLHLYLLRDDVVSQTDRQPRDELKLDVEHAHRNLVLRTYTLQ